MHLVLPIDTSPATPLPDEPLATVRQRAKQCLTTADELHAPASLAERAFSQRSPLRTSPQATVRQRVKRRYPTTLRSDTPS